MQDPTKRILFYSKLIGTFFALTGLGFVITALFIIKTSLKNKDEITVLESKILPSWTTISWGTDLSVVNNGHLVCKPLKPGKSWVGFRFQRKRRDAKLDYTRPVINKTWRKLGVLDFYLLGGTDPEGTFHPPPRLQFFFFVSPEQKTGHGVRIRDWHSESGSLKKEPRKWKHIVIPLKLFDFKNNFRIFAIAFQAAGELHNSFSVKKIMLSLRSEKELDKFLAPAPGTADFPALIELGRDFIPGKNQEPLIEQGTIFNRGLPQFMLGAQFNYDMRHDIWGHSVKPPQESKEKWAGYQQDLAWIYETIPNYSQLCRIGLNSWCAAAPPEPFLNHYLTEKLPEREHLNPGEFKSLASRISMPLSIDMTAFPWTLGELNGKSDLPSTIFSPAKSHDMPFNLLPAGQKLYLEYFKATAEFLEKEKIPVFQFELFNEPDYTPGSPLHKKDFSRYLQDNFPDKAKLAGYTDPDAAKPTNYVGTNAGSKNIYMTLAEQPPRKNLFLWQTRCEYLSGLFNGLTRAGIDVIRREYQLKKNYFSIQLNRWNVIEGTPIIQPENLFKELPIITSPTDGGNWTMGSGAYKKPLHSIDSPVAAAPLTADLLLSFSNGKKPILDQEFSCPGNGKALIRKLWLRILLGFDGVYLFSWSKRAWQWHTKDEGKRLAERRSFCLLNPFAHPPEELAAISMFRKEFLPFETILLPKPFGVKPVIGFLHSFTNEFAHEVITTPRREGRAAYSVLRYSNIPIEIVTGQQLQNNFSIYKDLKGLFVCGISVIEKNTLKSLENYVDSGGVLFLVDSPLRFDKYGGPINPKKLSGGALLGDKVSSSINLLNVPEVGLPGAVKGFTFRELLPGNTETVFVDNLGKPHVTLFKTESGGKVYTISFVGKNYSLLKLFLSLLKTEGIGSPWSITSIESGERAVNVLISVRDRGNKKVILFSNQDLFTKNIRFLWPGLKGTWRAGIYLEGKTIFHEDFKGEKGTKLEIPPEGVKLLMLEKKSEDEE